jgi:DNA-binding YbaB/EbfC family protein
MNSNYHNHLNEEKGESNMKANIPKGMGGGPQNMNAMIRQAQKMQEDMAAKQEELDAREYDVKAGGGVVGVKINGKREILSIDIEPEIVDPDDIETLSDILVAAINEAIKRVNDTNEKEMSAITGNMSMPGMF